MDSKDTGKDLTEIVLIRNILVGNSEVATAGTVHKDKPKALQRLVDVGKAALVNSPAAKAAIAAKAGRDKANKGKAAT